MSSLCGAIPAGLPNPQGVSLLTTVSNLVMVRHDQELQADKFAKSDFIVPYLRHTITGVFGQGINIELYRDNPRDAEDGDPDGLIDVPALKRALAAQEEEGAGDKKRRAPVGKGRDDVDDDSSSSSAATWEEDRQAPWVGQPSAIGKSGKEAEKIPPTKRPPPPRYPEPDADQARQKIPFTDELRKYIAKTWNKAGKELLEAGLTTGVVVCRTIEDNGERRHRCFGVVPTELRRVYFQVNSVGQVRRRWFVEYTDRKAANILVTGDGRVLDPEQSVQLESASAVFVDPAGKEILTVDPSVTVQDNENNRGYKLMDGSVHNLVFVFFRPDASGALTSPVFLSSEIVSALKATRFTETYTNFRRAQPTHVITTGPRQAGQGSGGTSGREQFTAALYAQGDVLQERKDYTFQQTMEDQKQYQLAAQIAAQRGSTIGGADVKQYMEIASLMANTGTPHYTPPDINAVANIYAGINLASPVATNAIVLPQGQTMMGGPMSEGCSNFTAWTDWLRGQLCAIWEIPPQKFDPTGAKFAADGEMVDAAWTARVRELCNETAEYLSILFSAAYEDKAVQFTKTIRAALSGGEGTSAGGAKKRKGAGGDPLSKIETPEAKKLNELLANDIKQRKRQEKEAIRKGLRVEVSFNISLPTGDPSLVTQLLTMDGIDKNTAIAALGEKAGIPRNMLLLTDEARAEQRRQRLQEETDAVVATMPPPPPPSNGEGKQADKQKTPVPKPVAKPPPKSSTETEKK